MHYFENVTLKSIASAISLNLNYSYLDKTLHERCSLGPICQYCHLKKYDEYIVHILAKLYAILQSQGNLQAHLLSKYIYEFKFHRNKQ